MAKQQVEYEDWRHNGERHIYREVGYFENRFGEQWVFVYDHKKKSGEQRGGDIGWGTVVTVRDGKVDVMLGKAEGAWLLACWLAATRIG